MIISKVYYISSLAIVVLSITSVLVASLCIWGFCLRVRGKKRKERFKKPDRRVDKSNYNKLNHSAPEEEKQDFETGSFDHSRTKSTNIVENVLSIAKRNLRVNDVHENSAEECMMTNNSIKKHKKAKSKKSKKGKTDESRKPKKVSKLTCITSRKTYTHDEMEEQYGRIEGATGGIDVDTMADGLQRDMAIPEGDTKITRKHSLEELRKEMQMDVDGRGASSRRPDQQLYYPPKAKEMQNMRTNKEPQKSSSATTGSNLLQEKSSNGKECEGIELNPPARVKAVGPSSSEEGTGIKYNAQYFEKKDGQEIHYRCKDSEVDKRDKDINNQLRYKRNINDEFSSDRLSADSNGNLRKNKNPNAFKSQMSVESEKEENATGVVYKSDSMEEDETFGNDNKDVKFEKSEVDWSDEQDASPPQLPMEVDSNKIVPDPTHNYENDGQKLIVRSAATVESISIPFLIDEYAAKEWRGETAMAARIRKGYSKVKDETGLICIRRVRGDNYCALRAVLFKALSSGVDILGGISKDIAIEELPRLLAQNHPWLTNWSFANRLRLLSNSVADTLSSCLHFLADIVRKSTSCYKDPERYKMILDVMNKSEGEEVKIFEAVKFLMLYTSIQLYEKIKTQESFELLGTLLFARDTSQDPESFMKNHLNCVGDTGGLDQLEMMLLGRTLNMVIKVFRLHRVDEDDFAVEFPDDLQDPEGDAILVAEDDRHYNVLSEEE